MKQIRPVDKITALWALSEAGLGGVFHAFKMPFTGLIIAGVSVLFLTMIAKLSDRRFKQILSATIIVLIIKMLISPHTPPTAYFAVFFQGVFGYLIYKLFGLNRISIIFFSMIALIESGLQKIVTLTIFYGVSIWESIDSFYEYLENMFGFLPAYSGTEIMLALYFGIYISSSLLFSWMILGILGGLETDHQLLRKEFERFVFNSAPDSGKKKSRFIGRRTWLFIILLLIISVLLVFNPDMGWQSAVYVFLRSVVVIILWYVIAAPLFKYLFERFLKNQKKRFSTELEFVMEIFPTLKSIAFFALKRNGRINSFIKLRQFFNDIIYLTLHVETGNYEQDHHHHRAGKER